MTTPTLIFLDTETTGLDPRRHHIWDLAYIIRRPGQPDTEHQIYINVTLDEADPFALRIGRFWDRHPDWAPHPPRAKDPDLPPAPQWAIPPAAAARAVVQHFRDAIVVGAVPWFDTTMLTALLHRHGLLPTWHYHLVDVEAFAAGALTIAPPWRLDELLQEYDLVHDESDRHTALGDTRRVRHLYDTVLALGNPAAGGQVPPS
jgi:DNA polymerase III alpha subunit (gram-positive type)